MDKFLELFEKLRIEKRSLAMSLGYHSNSDWCLFVVHRNSDTVIFDGQNVDLDRLGCEAYVKLYDWFIETFEYMV